MFIGHFAVGFAAKRVAPRTSLGWLVAAPVLLDLLWPVFLLLGWERVTIAPGDTAFTPLRFDSYPITHSLVTAIMWGAVAAVIYFATSRYGTGAVVIFCAVVSHWLLDVVTHRPDLPLYPGGPLVGLGLWSSVTGTVFVEAMLFTIGVAVYQHSTRALDGVGRWAWWGLVALLAVSFVMNTSGQAPPSVTAIAVVGLLGGGVSVALAWWADRHREALVGATQPIGLALRICFNIAVVLVGLTVYTGFADAPGVLRQASNAQQVIVGVTQLVYAVSAVLLLLGLWRRQAWTLVAARTWAVATTVTAGVATVAWGEAGVGAALAAVGGAGISTGLVVWCIARYLRVVAR